MKFVEYLSAVLDHHLRGVQDFLLLKFKAFVVSTQSSSGNSPTTIINNGKIGQHKIFYPARHLMFYPHKCSNSVASTSAVNICTNISTTMVTVYYSLSNKTDIAYFELGFSCQTTRC